MPIWNYQNLFNHSRSDHFFRKNDIVVIGEQSVSTVCPGGDSAS